MKPFKHRQFVSKAAEGARKLFTGQDPSHEYVISAKEMRLLTLACRINGIFGDLPLARKSAIIGDGGFLLEQALRGLASGVIDVQAEEWEVDREEVEKVRSEREAEGTALAGQLVFSSHAAEVA